jgi:hypothetical protein
MYRRFRSKIRQDSYRKIDTGILSNTYVHSYIPRPIAFMYVHRYQDNQNYVCMCGIYIPTQEKLNLFSL